MKLEEGDVVISAVKIAEEPDEAKRMIVRAYETEGRNTKAVIRLPAKPSRAYYVDLNECRVDNGSGISINDSSVSFAVKPYSVANICIEFEK